MVRKRTPAKTCRKCGETRNTAEFPSDKKMSDGLSSWCSSCHVEATRRWREQNTEQVDAYNGRRRAAYAAKQEAQAEALRAERQKREKELGAAWEAHQRRVKAFRKERVGEAA
jgi:hypothetical protein